MATKLYLPNLLEFIYNAIVEKGFKFLFDRLDHEDFLKVKTEARAKAFAENANIEDKIILMSKLGMGCAIVFWDKEKEKKSNVQDVVIAHIDTDPNDLAKILIKDKLFCSRDIDFIKSLQTISHICGSRVYSINRKFLQVHDHAIKTRTLENNLKAERNLHWYSNTILFGYDIEGALESFKIDLLQFRILLYLHTSPNGATKDNIAKKISRTNVTGMISEMNDLAMVTLSGETKNIVSIDVYGIMVLGQIFSKFP